MDRKELFRSACISLYLAHLMQDAKESAFFHSEGVEKFFEDWCDVSVADDIRPHIEGDILDCFMQTLNDNSKGKKK